MYCVCVCVLYMFKQILLSNYVHTCYICMTVYGYMAHTQLYNYYLCMCVHGVISGSICTLYCFHCKYEDEASLLIV